MSHHAHLSRKQLDRRGELREVPLSFSGDTAGGDEINAPIGVVIDIGRAFVVTVNGNLYLTGAGKCQFQEFTPDGLYRAARDGWFGFTLLWDEIHDEDEAEVVANS